MLARMYARRLKGYGAIGYGIGAAVADDLDSGLVRAALCITTRTRTRTGLTSWLKPGVLITTLTAPKLLILGTARRAKKASLPNPLHVYCTKIVSLWSSSETKVSTVSHRFDELDRERTMLNRSFSCGAPRRKQISLGP